MDTTSAFWAAGVLAVLAAICLALWLATLRRLRRLRESSSGSAADVARLRLSMAEQSGRLRIIHELHDLAVHRVATIISTAEGARYAGATGPDAAVRAAAGIGRATLADMRRVTTLVRESVADAAPRPTLASTRDLFRVMRDAGLTVQFEETGQPYDLNAAAELAVYRILQEALTNCLEYGGPGTTARVGFTWTTQGLAVSVDDDGVRTAVLRRSASPEEAAAELGYTVEDDLRALTRPLHGAGIGEMRERTELFGGSLTATEVPGIGFSIAATFPSIRHHNGVHGVDLEAHRATV